MTTVPKREEIISIERSLRQISLLKGCGEDTLVKTVKAMIQAVADPSLFAKISYSRRSSGTRVTMTPFKGSKAWTVMEGEFAAASHSRSLECNYSLNKISATHNHSGYQRLSYNWK